MALQAVFWWKQQRLEEAKSEALYAAEVFERLGATVDLEHCNLLLRRIDLKK